MAISDSDQRAITTLVSQYNFAMDHLDAAAWVGTFTEDGALVVNGATAGQGPQGLNAVVESRRQKGTLSHHWVTNFIITGDASKANLKCYVMSMTTTSDGQIEPYVLGEYDDDLVSVGGQWKFKVRRLTVIAGKTSVSK